jgi:hypothetical protein
MRYITYLFYSYFTKGPRRNVAYLSSILAVTLLVYINILLVFLLLKIDNYIPMNMSESKGSRYLKLMLLMSPIFFLLYFGVREKKIIELKEKAGYDSFGKEFNHRTLLFVYYFLSFAGLMTLAILKKSQ